MWKKIRFSDNIVGRIDFIQLEKDQTIVEYSQQIEKLHKELSHLQIN